jgi:ribosomal protein S14
MLSSKTRPAIKLHKVCRKCGIEKLHGTVQVIGICRECRKHEAQVKARENEDDLGYAFISYD